MSVIVKGMKMPESCMDCEIRQYDEYEDDNICPFSGIICLSIGRQDDCPLVALPDKHGRLGDLDALLDEIAVMPIDIGFGDVNRIEDIIREMPTIVESEDSE